MNWKAVETIKNYGDITKIKGSEVEITDVVIGGSPCQDLSVAGKRAGLEGERSGLFMEQIRLIKEMRKKDEERTDRGADEPVRPRFMVWENVCGAFSSNGGEDFRAVLEETAKIVDETIVIPKPPKGKWTYSGCIMGTDGKWSIAWRTHDAQYFGVPQRRKRISLVADFNGGGAPKVLFVGESVSRHPEQSNETGQGIAGDTKESVGASSYTLKVRGGVEIDSRGKKAGKGALVQTELSGTLGVSQDQTLITGINGDTAGCLDSSYYKGCGERNGVEREVVLGADMYNHSITGDIVVTLNASSGDSPTHSGPSVVYGISAYESNSMKSDNPHSGIYEADSSRTLDNNGGNPACNQGGIAVVQNCLNPWDVQSKHIMNEQGVAESLYSGECRYGGGESYVLTGNTEKSDAEPILLESNQDHATIQTNGVCTSLPAAMGEGGGYIPMVTEPIFAVDEGAGKSKCNITKNVSPTLATTHRGEPVVNAPLCFEPGSSVRVGGHIYEDSTGTIRANPGDNQQAVCYDARGNGNGETVPTITGDHNNRVTDFTALCCENPKVFSSSRRHNVFEEFEDVSETVQAHYGTGGNNTPIVVETDRGGAVQER